MSGPINVTSNPLPAAPFGASPYVQNNDNVSAIQNSGQETTEVNPNTDHTEVFTDTAQARFDKISNFSEKLKSLSSIAHENRIELPTKKEALSEIKKASPNFIKSLNNSIEKLKNQIKLQQNNIKLEQDSVKLEQDKIKLEHDKDKLIGLQNEVKFLKSQTKHVANFEKLTQSLNSDIAKLNKISPQRICETFSALLSDKNFDPETTKDKIFNLFQEIEDKFNTIDTILTTLCQNSATRHDSIDRLQEDYALFHAQINHTKALCMEIASDKTPPNKTFENLLYSESANMSGSSAVLSEIENKISPILSRLTEAKKKSQNALQINKIIEEANDAIGELKNIRENGIKKMEIASDKIPPNKTFENLLYSESANMSGSSAVLSEIENKISPILSRLTEAKKKSQNALQINKIIEEANDAIDELKNIRENGIKKGNDFILAPRSDIDALINTLQKHLKALNLSSPENTKLDELIKRSVSKVSYTSMFEKMLSFEPEEPIDGWRYYKLKEFLSEINKSLQKDKIIEVSTLNDLSHEKKAIETTLNKWFPNTNVNKAFSKIIDEFALYGKSLPDDSDEKKEYTAIFSLLSRRFDRKLEPYMDRIKQMENLKDTSNMQFKEADYEALLRGTDVVTLAYARASGLNNFHIQTQLSQSNLEPNAIKELGSGTFNTVKLVNYKTTNPDGTTTIQSKVFKPEFESRHGLSRGAVPVFLGYNDKQRSLDNNCASSYVAEKLGYPKLVSDAKFTVINGEAGILMTKAEGKTASAMKKDDFKFRKEAEKINVRGELMRELNRLHWIDILCAQCDRHRSNYLVNLDKENKSVSITGIDNDASFGENMVGVRSLLIPEDKVNTVFKNSKHFGISIPEKGVTKKDNDYIVDLEKLKPKDHVNILKKFGSFSTSMPTCIDVETYDHLIGINEEEYKTNLQEILHDEKAVTAAVTRLKEAKEYATKLLNKGRVISAWSDATNQKEIFKWQCDNYNNFKTDVKDRMAEPFLRDFGYLMDEF